MTGGNTIETSFRSRFHCECGHRAHVKDNNHGTLDGLQYNRRRYSCPSCQKTFATIEIRTDAVLVPSADKIGFRPLALLLMVAELFGVGNISPSSRRRLSFSHSSISQGGDYSDKKNFIPLSMDLPLMEDQISKSSKST